MSFQWTAWIPRCVAALLLFSGAVRAAAEEPARRVTVDLRRGFQMMDNFGASDCWSMQMLGAWSLENRERVADLLFSREKGIGLSCWRFNLGGGKNLEDIPDPWRTAETFEVSEGVYDWTRQANEQWFLGAAKARGVRQFVAFVNSPPARMTRNGLTRCTKGLGSTNLQDGYAPQFARYLADILEHFRNHPDPARRIDFGWVSPFNEPIWEWNGRDQEGNRAANDDIKEVVRLLDGELRRRRLPTRILAPESGLLAAMWGEYKWMSRKYGSIYGDYLDAFCGDPEVSGALGGVVCAHSYWNDLAPLMIQTGRRRFRMQLEKYPGWRYWMTEYCVMQGPDNRGGGGRDLGMETALDVARIIHYDLTLCNASAWQWWTAVSPVDFKDGLLYTDYRRPGDPESLFPSKTLWALGNYSRFIRPGARRVGLEGADDLEGLLGSAYRSASRGEVAVVLINRGAAAERVSLRVHGLPEGRTIRTFTPHVTSDTHDLAELPPVAADGDFTVPPRSVATLVGRVAAVPDRE